MTTEQLLSIGELADSTGVTVSALRHYDEVGVITPACRVGGKRRFNPDAVGRVNFIRRAQAAGFSLAEINDVLAENPVVARQLLATKIGELPRQQANLKTTVAMLEEVQACGCDAVAACPAIQEPC